MVWSSAILFLWLLATTVFSVVYKPTRQGKKIAWLVTVSFLFLLVELMIVLQFGHGTPVAEVATLLGGYPLACASGLYCVGGIS